MKRVDIYKENGRYAGCFVIPDETCELIKGLAERNDPRLETVAGTGNERLVEAIRNDETIRTPDRDPVDIDAALTDISRRLPRE